jgi:hypothetical protein
LLYKPGWSQISASPALASSVLELQACTITPVIASVLILYLLMIQFGLECH